MSCPQGNGRCTCRVWMTEGSRAAPTCMDMLWMHGQRDHRVSIADGRVICDLFADAGWNMTTITHEKGHMIPTEHHEEIRQWLNSLL